jgi:hypothetical protein
MRRLAILTAVLAMLAPAPAASAKGLIEATACGTDGCSTATSPRLLRALMQADAPARRAPHGEPFIAVELIHGHDGEEIARQSIAYVPSARMVAIDAQSWFSLPPASVRAFRRLTNGLRPFPPERLPDVWGGGLAPTQPLAAPPPPIAPEPVKAPAADGGAGFDWRIVLLPAIPLAVLIAVGVLAVRSRRWSGA